VDWDSPLVAEVLGVAAPGAGRFTAISTDTRRLGPGALFVALRGERFDAHDFLSAARERGATGAVVRAGTAPVAGLAYFTVPDTLVALGALARARRRRLAPGSPVVAITGSSGKTSTKELVRAALAVRFHVHATSGNLNNLVGVPLTILETPDDADALVVEVGASVPGEIARLRDVVEPTIAVVTNVGPAHLAGFGSLAAVLREKVSLVEGVPLAIVGTEPAELAREARARTRTIVAGTTAAAELRAAGAELDAAGGCVLHWAGHTVTLPLFGVHQADNAMLALAVARAAGVEPGAAFRALGGARIPGGRGRVVAVGRLTVIDDTYNANPASLARAVESAALLAQREDRPLAVVVGTMLELGAESARLHAAAAADIMRREPVLVGAVGEFATAFAPYRDRLGERLLEAGDADALGPRLRDALRGNEILLLKASRGVALEHVLRHLS
jgi:UDP-N-acetylmuramoyl-tripeptide--D-alanyl-D-alanine ligase